MTGQPQEKPIDPALYEVICAKQWFERYGSDRMPGYFEARISAYKRMEKEKARSRPAPLTQNDGGDCLVICQHCGKVTQVQCDQLPAARIDRENYEDLVYSSTPWTIYRQDAGMGEHDYAVFHNGVFFCRTNHSQTAREIIRAIRA